MQLVNKSEVSPERLFIFKTFTLTPQMDKKYLTRIVQCTIQYQHDSNNPNNKQLYNLFGLSKSVLIDSEEYGAKTLQMIASVFVLAQEYVSSKHFLINLEDQSFDRNEQFCCID